MAYNGRKADFSICSSKKCIDHKTLDRLKKNSNITALTLEKLCLILDCQPNDVITFVQK